MKNKKGYSQFLAPLLLFILLFMFFYTVEKVNLGVLITDDEIKEIDFVKQSKPLISSLVNPSPKKGDLTLSLIAADCTSGDLIYKNKKVGIGNGIVWYGDIDVNAARCIRIDLELQNDKISRFCKIFEIENGEKKEEKDC